MHLSMHLSMKLGCPDRTTYPNIKRGRMHALRYIAMILILNASGTEQNPNPRTPKYPWHIYSKATTWKQRGVACDDWEKWFHADCMHMSTPVYMYMALNNISWHCTNCGMPNFTSSLFESTIMSTRNSFSTLNSSHINNISTHSSGPPTSYSSPFNPIKRNKPQSQQHKIISINFQSIKKKEEVMILIEQADPSIIMGTETWLNPSISSAEIFPLNYEVIRKDRHDGYGVLQAIKKDFIIIIDSVDINTTSESLFAKLHLGKNWPFIGSVYSPPSSKETYIEHLCQRLNNNNRNVVFWIGRDMNLPDINW